MSWRVRSPKAGLVNFPTRSTRCWRTYLCRVRSSGRSSRRPFRSTRPEAWCQAALLGEVAPAEMSAARPGRGTRRRRIRHRCWRRPAVHRPHPHPAVLTAPDVDGAPAAPPAGGRTQLLEAHYSRIGWPGAGPVPSWRRLGGRVGSWHSDGLWWLGGGPLRSRTGTLAAFARRQLRLVEAGAGSQGVSVLLPVRARRPRLSALGNSSGLRDHCGRPAWAARRNTPPHVGDGTGERSARTISVWRSSLLSWKSQRLDCPPL